MSDRPEIIDLIYRVIGCDLVAVTEARHWYDDRRGGDEQSLLHFWLHFRGNPPLMAHGCGDDLLLEFGEPYGAYDMGERGEVRVGLAAAPDVLACLPGHRLLNAAIIRGNMAASSVSGVLLRFDHDDLIIASFCDEWVLRREKMPPEVVPYLTIDKWLLQPPGDTG